ncbi:DUF642 domain-containing protein [Calothrix sp. PCC 7507]|uniref:DUF642 domain-containing protein n=1 Tax=Calothrix sp. PCC 7507 TaxID=99598 RepID=UPI00029EC583|nr:DUF642 domain-containing protein [Calothrix sp. PCC 7507]AFY33067.1 PEP motif putative anchor domain protein [Calothrix sp. PCC 7507]
MAFLIKKLGSFVATASALTVLPMVLAKPAAAKPVPVTDIVTNGSFENPQLGYGSWGTFNSIEGWNLLSGSDNHGIEVQNHAAGNPFDGSNLVELDSYGNTGIFQDLATKAGKKYKLEFAFSPRAGVSENLLNIKWGDKLVDTLSANGAGLSDTLWKTFSYNLVATSNLTRLSFDNFGSKSDSFGTYIDKVSVTSVTAVPEPASIMGLLAFGAFGATSVCKRKQQKATVQA